MDLLQTVCRRAVLPSTRPALLSAASRALPRPTSYLARSFSATPTNLSTGNSNPAVAPIERIRNLIRTRQGPSGLPPRPPPPSDSSIFDLPKEIKADADRALKLFSKDEFIDQYDLRPKEPPLRLRPSTGRTVNVTAGSDAAKALRQLDQLTKRNRVAREFNLQRFHERPALKRKRQRRERWRQRFSQSVRAAISRTIQLKAQGW